MAVVFNAGAAGGTVSVPVCERGSSEWHSVAVDSRRCAVKVAGDVWRQVRAAADQAVRAALVRHVLRLPGQRDRLSPTAASTGTLRGTGQGRR